MNLFLGFSHFFLLFGAAALYFGLIQSPLCHCLLCEASQIILPSELIISSLNFFMA